MRLSGMSAAIKSLHTIDTDELIGAMTGEEKKRLVDDLQKSITKWEGLLRINAILAEENDE